MLSYLQFIIPLLGRNKANSFRCNQRFVQKGPEVTFQKCWTNLLFPVLAQADRSVHGTEHYEQRHHLTALPVNLTKTNIISFLQKQPPRTKIMTQ